MNRVMERVIQLEITARAVAEHKIILFSAVREGFLHCFTLHVMCLKHRDVRQGDQAAHKGASPSIVVIVTKSDISLGLHQRGGLGWCSGRSVWSS